MTTAINIRFNGESNLGAIHKDLARLRAEFAAMQAEAVKSSAGSVNRYATLGRQMGDVRQQFGLTTAAAGEFEIRQTKLISQSERYAEALKQQKVGFVEAISQRKLLNTVLREQIALQNSSSLAWSKDSAGRISADLITPMGNIAANTRQRLGLYNEMLKSVATNTVNWGKNTQWAGRQLMTGLTLPLGILAGATALIAFNIDKELTKVVKVYGDVVNGISETPEQIKAAAKSTVEASAKAFGTTHQDTLEIMAGLAAAGKTGNELQQETMATNRIALAGELSAQDAMQATITLQSVYHHNAQQIGDDYAYINAMENQTVLTSQDFVTAIPKVVGVMNAMGASLQDVGTLLVAMKAGGIDAAQGANALKAIDFRLLATYKRGLDTFKTETGTDLRALVASTNGDIIPTLMKFGGAIQNLSKVQQVAVIKDVFGIYQGSKAFTLIQQLLTGSEQMTSAFRVAGQSAKENNDILNNELKILAESPSQKIKVAWASIQVTLEKVGGTILPIAADIVAGIGSLVTKFAELSPARKNFLLITAAAVGLAGPIIMIVGLTANLIGNIVKIIAFMQGLILKFRITDVAERTTMLQGKAATQVWDLQAAAVSRLTMSLDALIAAQQREFLAANPGVATAAAAERRAATVAASSYGKTGITPSVPMPKTELPFGPLTKNGERMSAARAYALPGGAVAQINGVDATITRAQLKTQMLKEAVRGVESQEILLNRTLEVQNVIRGQGLALEKQRLINLTAGFRNFGGSAMLAGSMGMMLGGTDSLIGKLSMAVTLAGTLGMVFPITLAKIAARFLAAATAAKVFAASVIPVTKFGQAASSMLSSSIAALTAAGPAIAATAAVAFVGWKLLADAEQKATDAAIQYGKTTNTMADLLGFSMQENSGQIKKGVKATMEQVIATKNEFMEKNPDAGRMFTTRFDKDDSSAKTEGERWAAAVAEGASVKLHGGTTMMAENATRVAMSLMSRNFSDADFEAELKVHINFEDARATADAQIEGLKIKLEQALSSTGEGAEGFFRSTILGNDDLSSWGSQAAKDTADAFMNTIKEVGPKAAPLAFANFFGSAQKPLEDSYATVMGALGRNGAPMMAKYGITSAKTFADAMLKQSPAMQESILSATSLTQAQIGRIKKNADLVQTLFTQSAIKGGIDPETASSINSVIDLIEALGTGIVAQTGAYIDITQATLNYNAALKALGGPQGLKVNDTIALTQLNIQRLAMGLPETTSLLDGLSGSFYVTEEAAAAAAGGVASLSTMLEKMGLNTVGITAESAIAQYKSMITGTITDIAAEATAGIDAVGEAQIAAQEAAGTRALEAIEERGKKADEAAQKISDSVNARQEREKDALNARQEQAKRALDDQHKAARLALEQYYDHRNDVIKKAIDVEKAAEDFRQKIFEAEKSRIQRLADMYSKNVDLNMAINSGSLDEAAKIQNDMIATQQGWAVDDAKDVSATASEKKITALEAQIESINKIKDVRLTALEKTETAEKDALNARLKREDSALQAVHKKEDTALKIVQKGARDRIDAEKKAQQEINKNNAATVAARVAANKAGYAAELEMLMVSIPTSEKKMNEWIERLKGIYKRYGEGTLVPNGKKWALIISDALKYNTDKSAAEVANSAAWSLAGNDIVTNMLKGGFNMTRREFIAWLNGGVLPPKALAQLPKTAAEKRYEYDLRHIGRSEGGPVWGAGTPTSDSINARLSDGEYVVNAKQTAKYRPLIKAINDDTVNFATGGLVKGDAPLGLGTPILMGQAMLMENIMRDTIVAAANRRIAEDAGGAKDTKLLLQGGKGKIPELGGAELPGGGALWQRMWAWIHARDPAVKLTSGLRPGSITSSGNLSLHALGSAVDLAPPNMGIFNMIKNAFGASIAELIYTPAGKAAIKNGKAVGMGYYGPRVAMDHYDHVHWGMSPNYVGSNLSGVSGGRMTSNSNTALGQRMAAAYGWTGSQWEALNKLWTNESGWNNTAQNPTSTAYGIAQFLDSTWPGYGTKTSDPAGQIAAGLKYVKGRYGTPINALNFWNNQSPHWYSGGGELSMSPLKTGGYTLNDGYAKLHKAETVLTAPLSEKLNVGLEQLANGPVTTYTIKADFNGATFATDVDVERAFQSLMDKAERRNGSNRKVGSQ